MRRITLGVAIVCVALLATGAAAQQEIDGWDEIRESMELFKGALDRTVGQTVLNTYVPGFGVVFLFSTQFDGELGSVRREVERALTFITPTIDLLQPGERIVISGYHEGFMDEWEIMYIADAESSGDPDTWEVYLNRM